MSSNTDCVGPGWAPLIKVLDAEAERLGIEVVQVKEKFGGLRYYTQTPEGLPGNTVQMFDSLVGACEHLSLHMCEECGEPGKACTPGDRGWIKTRCAEHAK